MAVGGWDTRSKVMDTMAADICKSPTKTVQPPPKNEVSQCVITSVT